MNPIDFHNFSFALLKQIAHDKDWLHKNKGHKSYNAIKDKLQVQIDFYNMAEGLHNELWGEIEMMKIRLNSLRAERDMLMAQQMGETKGIWEKVQPSIRKMMSNREERINHDAAICKMTRANELES